MSKLICTVFVLFLAACAAPEADNDLVAGLMGPLTDDTPDGQGVLSLLNDASTTFTVLDIDAHLDKRAAKNLIAHRNGPDGEFGTADDNPFDTIAEADAVKWVGPSALGRLLDYATLNGFIPQADDVMGTFEKVPFTLSQAQKALALVNSASFKTLDVDVALDKRAAAAIVKARPIASLSALADVYYVGKTALTRIRDFAQPVEPVDPVEPEPVEPEPVGLPQGSDCKAKSDCQSGLKCLGIPADGSGDKGKCVNTKPLPGEGDYCGQYSPCQDGLLCIGSTLWGEGDCGAQWFAGTYINDSVKEIPDSEVPWDCGDKCPSTSSSVVVYGLASVPVDIVVTVQIAHSKNTDLLVTLTDPNGDTAVLWKNSNEVGDGLSKSYVTNGISRDDAVNGKWTLKVADTKHGGGGYLKGWKMLVTSRWD